MAYGESASPIPYSAPKIGVTSIDGVATLWADVPGPFYASLSFRAGRSDERLVTSGIAHLAEHLAVPPEPSHLVDVNAAVDLTRTTFVASGDRRAVCSYLEEVVVRMHAVDAGRIEQEAAVLLQEEATMGPSPVGDLLRVRYGASGYGVAGFEQLGLYRPTLRDLEDWAARYFTSANAVLVLSSEPPTELRLPLPSGKLVGPKEPHPPLVDTPFIGDGLPGAVVIGMVSGPSPAAAAGLNVAVERLLRRLRHELATTYGVEAGNEALGPSLVHRTLFADVREGWEASAVREILSVIESLATDGPTDEERERERVRFVRQHDEPTSVLGLMDFMAEEQLYGRPTTAEEIFDRSVSPTGSDIRDAMAAARATTVMLVPEGTVDAPPTWHTFRAVGSEPFEGRSFRPSGVRNRLSSDRFVVGSGGFSLRLEGTWQSVRWDDVEVAVTAGDSRFFIIARDGAWIDIDPRGWSGGSALRREIVDHLPAVRHIVVPPDQLPSPR